MMLHAREIERRVLITLIIQISICFCHVASLLYATLLLPESIERKGHCKPLSCARLGQMLSPSLRRCCASALRLALRPCLQLCVRGRRWSRGRRGASLIL